MARATPELHLHMAVADLLTRFAAPGVVWWHTYNNTISVRHGAKMKRLGVRAGVPDFTLLLPINNGVHPTWARPIFIELKSDKGRLSPAQLQFRDDVCAMGCPYYTGRDIDQITAILSAIGALKPNVKVAA